MQIKKCKTFIGYSASECGHVFSHRRRGTRIQGQLGTVENIDYSFTKELKPFRVKKGYLQVCVRVNNMFRPIGVHRLVIDAFQGPPMPGHHVRHLDNNPANNHASNLAYGTVMENNHDRMAAGHYFKGGQHHNAKLTNQQAEEVRALRRSKIKVKILAERFNVSVSTIEAVIYRKGYND